MHSPFNLSSGPSGRLASVVTATVLLVSIAACAPMNPTPMTTSYPSGPVYSGYPTGPVYSGNPAGAIEYGRVTNVEVIRTQDAGSNNATAGTIIGGVAGAVIGHQIGSGTGKDLATIAGGVGGAVVGNQIAKNTNPQVRDTYRISVQVDGGAFRSYDMGTAVDLRPGDRVRIQNGQLFRM